MAKGKRIETNKNIAAELVASTEDYRIDKIYALLNISGKDTTRQQAIRYLLSYADMLPETIAHGTVDIANKMVNDSNVKDTVRVKIACDLKAFLGGTVRVKQFKTSFEELRKANGFIEVEVPD